MKSRLEDERIDMKLKNRHWYNRKEKYLYLKFDVKVILGAADLRFQLLSKDNVLLSNDHDAIHGKWETPSEAPYTEKRTSIRMFRAD